MWIRLNHVNDRKISYLLTLPFTIMAPSYKNSHCFKNLTSSSSTHISMLWSTSLQWVIRSHLLHKSCLQIWSSEQGITRYYFKIEDIVRMGADEMLKTNFSVIRSCFNSISIELMIILTPMVSVNRKVWCKQSYRKMRKGMMLVK